MPYNSVNYKGESDEGRQKVQTSSYEINTKYQGCNVQYDDYR